MNSEKERQKKREQFLNRAGNVSCLVIVFYDPCIYYTSYGMQYMQLLLYAKCTQSIREKMK